VNQSEAIKLIEEHQPLIRKVCLMYAQDSDEADDMFQEVCIQAWRASSQFKGDSKFSTWLYRISINTAISWIRKEKKHKHGETENERFYGIHDDKPFYEEEHKKEQIASMYRAINKLNDLDRSLVLLYLEDVAYAEISEILGLTVTNIKVKMNRLKKRLKKLMEENG
jgi:RNA polymerase sigma-70 factor (ECF subfamily)